ncbi:hypothetical protein HRR83_008073 [Exophiala dermatitidis]|uniref:Uncharacterized protein n=2 Tax=Exophiala dermatitidis TaxID=5970 RepID=H6BTE8_EXODN
MFPILVLVMASIASALVLPRQAHPLELSKPGTQDLVKRNMTVGTQQLNLNIDPDIINPVCGGIYPANINVQSAPDPFYLTTACDKVLGYIGGAKGSKNVDVVFACQAQPTTGTGDRDIKMILNTQANFVLDGSGGGTQNIPANMELTSESDNFFLSTSVNIGVKVSSSSGKITFQYIFC